MGEHRTWYITGVSSGFGNEITKQALANGDTVIGSVRNTAKIQDLIEQYPDTFSYVVMDMTDIQLVKETTKAVFESHDRIDVLVSNAGYGLYGAAEEFSDEEMDHQIATNFRGPIELIQTSLPYFRKQESGRIIQISSVGGQVAYLGNSLYCATKFGIEGYVKCVGLEMEKFNVGVTLVEPGGARTDYRYGGARITKNLKPELEHAHGFLDMVNPEKGLAPGDPVKMATRIIESLDMEPVPVHLAFGSKAWDQIITELSERLASYVKLKDLSCSTDVEE